MRYSFPLTRFPSLTKGSPSPNTVIDLGGIKKILSSTAVKSLKPVMAIKLAATKNPIGMLRSKMAFNTKALTMDYQLAMLASAVHSVNPKLRLQFLAIIGEEGTVIVPRYFLFKDISKVESLINQQLSYGNIRLAQGSAEETNEEPQDSDN